MTPFNENRKAYITVCFITAVIYAFVAGTGVNHPVIFCLVDGVIYGIILFSAGFALYTVFRFAIPVNYSPKYRIIFISALIVITTALVTGIEAFTVRLFFSSTFDSFVSTIPVRFFITFLLFIILYLTGHFFHESIEGKRDYSENIFEKNPMDSSQTNISDKSDTANPANKSSAVQIVDRITVRSGQKIRIIPIESILYIKAEGDYISIHTAEGNWLKEQTMKYTEDRLPVNSFVRIHRSYIVNIHKISRIERYGEKQQVVLSNNEKIIISAARYQSLKQILGI